MVAKFAMACGAVLLAVMLTGCVQQNTLANLPPPRFNGPTIVKAAPPPLAPHIAATPNYKPVSPGGPREWMPNAAPRPWRWIVIHHSATPSGSAGKFDRDHRAKGWDELGYHFVVGNGTETRMGQIEVGPRWPKQKWGAHAKTPDNRYNDFGIGICLVGNYDVDRPPQEQLKSLAKLVAYLMKTYNITPDRILGHGDTKPTDCPGRNVNVAQVRRMATQMLADAGESIDVEPETKLAGELLTPDGVK